MFHTLITNNTHTPTRVAWRTGCATPVNPGESKLVDGAPFEFRNPREVAVLLDRCKSGALTIALVTSGDFDIISIEVAGQRAAKSQIDAKVKKEKAPGFKKPAVPKVPANVPTVSTPEIQANNEGMLSKGSIEDNKPKVGHVIPGTEDDAAIKEPAVQVSIFEDMPPMTKEAQRHITDNKLTREVLSGISQIKGTGANGVITLNDLDLFLNPPPPAEPEKADKNTDISIAAKKMIDDLGITAKDIENIVPTGRNGKMITKGDVQLFIDNKG